MSTPHASPAASTAVKNPMLTVIKEIVASAGRTEEFETAEEFHLSIPNRPYMRLVIESHATSTDYGTGATRWISAAHYAEKQSPTDDLIVDTDIELLDNGANLALTYAWGRFYERVFWLEDDGRVMTNPKAQASVRSFANMWARNLREQGFIEAARTFGMQPPQTA